MTRKPTDLEAYEPEEGDLVTEDHVHFYQDGKLVLAIQAHEGRREEHGGRFLKHTTHAAAEGDVSDAELWRQLDAYMQRTHFYPNVWWISDHGNAHLLSRPKRSRRRKQR